MYPEGVHTSKMCMQPPTPLQPTPSQPTRSHPMNLLDLEGFQQPDSDGPIPRARIPLSFSS